MIPNIIIYSNENKGSSLLLPAQGRAGQWQHLLWRRISQNKIRAIQTKLQRLLDGYLEQDIEREVYRLEKAKLLSEKKSLDEKMARIEQKQNDWLEPFQNWIKVATTLVKIARDSNLLDKKVAAKEIFGSNLRLASRAVRGEPVFPYLSALRAAESVGQKSESLILVELYNSARTFFERN